MSTFSIPSTHPFPGTEITLPTNLTQPQLLSFRPFNTWLTTLSHSLNLQSQPSHPFNRTPYHLRTIEIQSADFFGSSRLGFLKFRATISNDQGETLPGSVFMRGGSVAMVIILTPTDALPQSSEAKTKKEEFLLLTVQPRIAAASFSFTELPAGMLDDSGTFSGAAAKEIKEETGLEIKEDELVDLTALASTALSETKSHDSGEEGKEEGQGEELQKAMYPSAGGSDEFVPILMVRKEMKGSEIEGLKGKLSGLREEGEKITLMVVRLEEAWKWGFRDGKVLGALGLLEGLRREGRL